MIDLYSLLGFRGIERLKEDGSERVGGETVKVNITHKTRDTNSIVVG